MTSTTKSRPAVTTGALIDELFDLRKRKERLNEDIKKIDEDAALLEEQLEAKMNADGVEKATGKRASVSFTSTVVASVDGDDGWSKLHAYIKKTGYFHLLQRRVSDPAYRELLEAGKKVPGVQPFTKKRINLRAVAS